jgi:hypothetical protein
MEEIIMFDILNNHRVILFKSYAQLATGNETLTDVDMWANGQRPNRILFIVDVGANAGALTLTFRDSSDDSTYDADFAVSAAMDTTGLFLIDLVDFYRYLRVYAVAAGGNVSYGLYGITFEDRGRPVTQDGDTVALTYGTGRKPRVATS